VTGPPASTGLPWPRQYGVVELDASGRHDAVRVLADAFVGDPAWVAIGPRRERARMRLLERYYAILVGEALRFAGPSYCAVDHGKVVGVALTYADGREFPPPNATLRESRPFLLAGPGPGMRGAYVDSVMKRAHPDDAHVYLWYLGVDPSMQRRGVGRALMQRVLEDAADSDLQIYLETTKPENVGYYESFGFRTVGDARLVRGAHVWFMQRRPQPPLLAERRSP
jgi:ribosomal protein S18 acetylase RimI-like enzyme